jgi:hypothetical protein
VNIKIRAGRVELNAILNDTPTAKQVAGALPRNSRFNSWGDEIYFSIPVEAELEEDAREEVQMGDLGYWPAESAFCIFFGPTPMSKEGKIVPASAVNIIGKITDDAGRMTKWSVESLKAVKRAVYHGLHSDLQGHLDYMSSQLALLSQTPEHRKAVEDFAHRKDPKTS